MMAEVLTESKKLELLDLSYNFIDQKSIFCIAYGLKFTSSLKSIAVEGNPIGPTGLRFLIQAMNSNQNGKFSMNLKEISADKDIKLYNEVFDPSNPERAYTLNLSETYNYIIL